MSIMDILRDGGHEPDGVADIIERALVEDLGPQWLDPTSDAIFDETVAGAADIVAREPGVVAGLAVAHAVFARVDVSGDLKFAPRVADGARVDRGDVLATVSGRVRYLLMAERTVLNILSRMSGVATHTARWASELSGTGTTILDTRKTNPGLRVLDKYSVRAGGGGNKRMGLYDAAMIKDNHKFAAGSVSAALAAVTKKYPQIAVQVEVDTFDEAREAVEAGATFLLCDNMSPQLLREVVDMVAGKAELEATGNITVDRAREYAESGVDYISAGALTHSSPILDIALDIRTDN